MKGSDVLLGDLDGDTYPDMITNQVGLTTSHDTSRQLNNTGSTMSVQWGRQDGSFGGDDDDYWDEINTVLETNEPGEVGTAAVADFNKDGVLDLIVNAVRPRGGEKPSKAHLAEYRPGPVDRSTLDSPDARHLDIGDTGEVRSMGIDRYGKDAYPDLVMANGLGGDREERSVRLTTDKGGPGKYDAKANEKYGATGKPDAWKLPRDGWQKFYDQCGSS